MSGSEVQSMNCSLWKQCRKHPAFGMDWLIDVRANCPHFVVGGVLDARNGRSWIHSVSITSPCHAIVQGGSCVCTAYEPAEDGSVSSVDDLSKRPGAYYRNVHTGEIVRFVAIVEGRMLVAKQMHSVPADSGAYAYDAELDEAHRKVEDDWGPGGSVSSESGEV
jgi:hypothetical protein